MEYVTVVEAREELGDWAADLSDAALQRALDHVAATMEEHLGHAFGRALLAHSQDAAHTVRVTTTELIIGGDSYAFADHATLRALTDAVNGAGEAYSLDLLSTVEPRTPSTSLAARAETACGGGYENRQTLDTIHMYSLLSGRNTTALYLPLPAVEIVSATEDGTALTCGADYVVDETRLVLWRLNGRRWSARSPENVAVLWIPRWWRNPPPSCRGTILEALSARIGAGGLESESFGPYSYRRATTAEPWRQIVMTPTLNLYRTRVSFVY